MEVKNYRYKLLCLMSLFFASGMCNMLLGQEKDIAGFEINLDQDYFADFVRSGDNFDNNYAVAMRIGFYGAYANHDFLGAPWVRKRIDRFLFDNMLYSKGFNEEKESHNFAFVINGFSPSIISDQTNSFLLATALGYDPAIDRPFSSFTGIRSTRRLEGSKRFVHSANVVDLALTTSFSFGIMSLGTGRAIENLLGRNRPDGNLWNKDDTKPYPTGQLIPTGIPMFMYSISAEAVVWRPVKKVLFQVRPEINLGSYTNLGIGIDFGKVMNVERHIDNLGYTDLNNPGLIVVNNDNLGLSIVSGATARVVFYNAHLNGLYGASRREAIGFGDMKKFVFEYYVGVKLQLFKKVEFSYSFNRRTAEFTGEAMKAPFWGTFGFKFLLAPEGEGCYD